MRPSDMYMHQSTNTIIGSDNGLSPGWRQAIIWTHAGILLIWTLGTNISEIVSKIHTFSFKKMHLKMLSAKWQPICPGLNVLNTQIQAFLYLNWEINLEICHMNESQQNIYNYMNKLKKTMIYHAITVININSSDAWQNILWINTVYHACWCTTK